MFPRPFLVREQTRKRKSGSMRVYHAMISVLVCWRGDKDNRAPCGRLTLCDGHESSSVAGDGRQHHRADQRGPKIEKDKNTSPGFEASRD